MTRHKQKASSPAQIIFICRMFETDKKPWEICNFMAHLKIHPTSSNVATQHGIKTPLKVK